jgi:hypothetical protein
VLPNASQICRSIFSVNDLIYHRFDGGEPVNDNT